MKIKFKATQVFHDIWNAIHETIIDNGNVKRKYRLFEEVGGSRSSKTWSNFQVIYLYSVQNRMKNIVVMRDTASDCRDKVETDWRQWLKDPNLRIKEYEDGKISVEQLDEYLKVEDLSQYMVENKSLHTWTNKQTGSFITFTGTDDENRAIGKSQHVLWVNEPYMFSEEVFKQLSQRTSDFIIVDWNPKANHFIEKQRLKPDTFTHRSSLLMNPFCPIESKKQILSYQPIKYARAVLNGLFNNQDNEFELRKALDYDFENNPLQLSKRDLNELLRCKNNEERLTASDYHYKVYFLGEKAEKPNRIFNWRKISKLEFDELTPKAECIGVDWGKVDPWGILHAKYIDGKLYLRELNYQSENEIRNSIGANESVQIGNDDEGIGIVVWKFNKLGIKKTTPIICDNNRPLKIAGLRRAGWEKALPASKPKGSIIDGIGLLENLEVYYTEDSPNIELEQENYSYKTDRYGIQLEDTEDANNHTIDPARYVALYLQSIGIIKSV